jgi:1,4-dihydroxy-2-naphthoate polyprenyltransferase
MLRTMPLSASARVFEFVKLGRPKFLIGGLLFYGLGASLAATTGVAIDWQGYAWGQAIVTLTQLMTHYSNDYFDLEADRANLTPTLWSGGSRVLVRGTIAPIAAVVAALVLGGAALILTVALTAYLPQKLVILPLALSMIALSWCYSAPPLRLLSRGLGELTTALVVTLLTPLLGFCLQMSTIEPLPFLVCAPLCGLQFAMLLTIELPDAAGDAAKGKRTLVVRWGAEWGARWASVAVTVSFLALPVLALCGLPKPIAAAAFLPAPFGAWHGVRLFRGAFREPKHWESLAFCSVLLLFLTACAELIGVWFIA